MQGPITCIFIGKSGAGKGTQAALLRQYLEQHASEHPFLQLETGQHFRNFISGPTRSAHLAKEIMDAGKLQPSFLAIWNWAGAFINQFTGTEHIILDGTPRTLIEAQALETAFKFYRREHSYVIYLDIGEEEARKRLLERGRADDNEEDIKSRLGWFKTDVEPAADFFRDRAGFTFLNINGEQSIEAVHQAIVGQLK